MTGPLPVPSNDRRTIAVFVHLAYGFDARTWEEAWRAGRLIGFNTRTPYGYHLAEGAGCRVAFSKDRREGMIMRVLRLGVRTLLGFDLVHAWRNRREAFASDIVWTHTESQFLAFALLLALTGRGHRPKLLGQTVWIVDRWHRYTPLHRMLYRWLMRRVDVLTLHSPLNLARARAMFPTTRCDLVLFGIPSDSAPTVGPRGDRAPIKAIAVGNDEHRDWDTLLSALGGSGECELRIVTGSLRPERGDAYPNVRIAPVETNDDLRELYRTADLMIVPTKPNLHASGNTVMQEAALAGLPIVASDTGGLRAYFSDEAVRYVAPGDPRALADAVASLARDPEARGRLGACAAARMGPSGLGADAYVARHVALSIELLADADPAAHRVGSGRPDRRAQGGRA